MKCAPVQLLNRSEYSRRKFNRNFPRNIEPVYITKGYHGYSFTFVRNQSPVAEKQPTLSVKNINLPENVNKFNTGHSLEKWSKKAPRLRSGKKKTTASNSDPVEQDYDISFDVNDMLDCLDESQIQDDSTETPNGEEYEINSDIEELLRKSQEGEQMEKKERKRFKPQGGGMGLKTNPEREIGIN
ncbi:hypothetical protein NQ314_009549 [Rhamnusium bicolor]|uniref:Uncharacterized protein n=1 Tax=Rhamnusium bicolor TaxID=1586634 RepID=A0AAV8XZK0_9CUCU|nr:hypothetical protein NQ314_009549 [Rhamnusium bicolor]